MEAAVQEIWGDLSQAAENGRSERLEGCASSKAGHCAKLLFQSFIDRLIEWFTEKLIEAIHSVVN